MPIGLKKINDEKVNSIKVQKGDGKKKIKGEKLFPELYANIFLCGKKKSGKTSATFKILKDCAGKHTKIIVFSATVNNDANWLEIQKYFEEKEISLTPMTSIYNDEGKNLVLTIRKTLAEKAEKEKERAKKGEGPPTQLIAIDSDDEDDDEDDEKKEKALSPEYIIVFDDLSDQLRDRSIDTLLKSNRHFKLKIIISSQYYIDMIPSARQQLDYLLLFPKIAEEKLKMIWKDADLDLDYLEFLTLYKTATEQPYNFFYVDTRQDKYRKNFNQEFLIS